MARLSCPPIRLGGVTRRAFLASRQSVCLRHSTASPRPTPVRAGSVVQFYTATFSAPRITVSLVVTTIVPGLVGGGTGRIIPGATTRDWASTTAGGQTGV